MNDNLSLYFISLLVFCFVQPSTVLFEFPHLNCALLNYEAFLKQTGLFNFVRIELSVGKCV